MHVEHSWSIDCWSSVHCTRRFALSPRASGPSRSVSVCSIYWILDIGGYTCSGLGNVSAGENSLCVTPEEIYTSQEIEGGGNSPHFDHSPSANVVCEICSSSPERSLRSNFETAPASAAASPLERRLFREVYLVPKNVCGLSTSGSCQLLDSVCRRLQCGEIVLTAQQSVESTLWTS